MTRSRTAAAAADGSVDDDALADASLDGAVDDDAEPDELDAATDAETSDR